MDFEGKNFQNSNEDNNQLYIYFILNYYYFNYDAKVKFLDSNIEIYFFTNNSQKLLTGVNYLISSSLVYKIKLNISI